MLTVYHAYPYFEGYLLKSLPPLVRLAIPDKVTFFHFAIICTRLVGAETADCHQLPHLAPSTPFGFDFTNCVKGDPRFCCCWMGTLGIGVNPWNNFWPNNPGWNSSTSHPLARIGTSRSLCGSKPAMPSATTICMRTAFGLLCAASLHHLEHTLFPLDFLSRYAPAILYEV